MVTRRWRISRIVSLGLTVLHTALSGGFGSISPKVGSLKILETGPSSLLIQAKVNFTNPTEYSAQVPFVTVNILNNDTVLGQATTKNIAVKPGANIDIMVEALWDPQSMSGQEGRAVGRELLSQYISGRKSCGKDIRRSADRLRMEYDVDVQDA